MLYLVKSIVNLIILCEKKLGAPSVNKLFNLDLQLIRQILRDSELNFHQQQQQNSTAHWVEVEVEFDMIVDESFRGICNIKVIKTSRNAGLGVTGNHVKFFFKFFLIILHIFRFTLRFVCCNGYKTWIQRIELRSKLAIFFSQLIPPQFRISMSTFC